MCSGLSGWRCWKCILSQISDSFAINKPRGARGVGSLTVMAEELRGEEMEGWLKNDSTFVWFVFFKQLMQHIFTNTNLTNAKK